MADDKPKVYRARLSDFVPDSQNANRGTERGRYMVEKSLEEVGAARSLVADAHNKIPAGNKTLEAAVEAGFDEVIVVETDGRQVVVVKRTDWDLEDSDPNNPARRYAYFDNRAGQVDLDFDAAQIIADVEAGIDLSAMFHNWELDELGAEAGLELEDVGPNTITVDKRQSAIKVAVFAEQVATFEAALKLTGEVNRGKALTAVCQEYLKRHGVQAKGQFDTGLEDLITQALAG